MARKWCINCKRYVVPKSKFPLKKMILSIFFLIIPPLGVILILINLAYWLHIRNRCPLCNDRNYGEAPVTYEKTRDSEPQILREREIVREVEIIYCRYCGAKNNARRTSCSQCGGNLH